MDWFLYDRDLHHEWIKEDNIGNIGTRKYWYFKMYLMSKWNHKSWAPKT